MRDQLVKANEALTWLRGRLGDGAGVDLAITLGTGLGDFANDIDKVYSIPYEDIPGFPTSTVQSHAGRLIVGTLAGAKVAVLDGRFHLYEGYSPQEVTFPARVLALMGAEDFIFCNAAGGLDLGLKSGGVMLIRDHINLTGHNPLRGPNVEQWGERFPDMGRTYDADLCRLARQVAGAEGVDLAEGVYVSVMGPSLETPAETRMLRLMGADAVGMSTVLEVIAARHMNRRVLALSAIANVNDPDDMEPIPLDLIIQNAGRAGKDLGRIIKGVARHLGGQARGRS